MSKDLLLCLIDDANHLKAGVAQLVEQLICNQSVMSSSLFTSFNKDTDKLLDGNYY